MSYIFVPLTGFFRLNLYIYYTDTNGMFIRVERFVVKEPLHMDIEYI